MRLLYIQLHLRTDKCEPSDAEGNGHLDLRDRSDVVEYDWVDTKIVYNSYFLSNEDVIDAARTMVGDPSEWSALPVGSEKRICISFDDCVIPLYDFLFSRIGMRFPFCDFRVVVLKYLNVAPS